MSLQNNSESVKRITLKRKRPNPLFREWLQELYDEAKAKKSKLESMLLEALTSLDKYPLPLQTGAECAILKGFDQRLCLFLDKHLEVYRDVDCQPQSVESGPDDNENVDKSNIISSRSSSISSGSDERNTALGNTDLQGSSEKPTNNVSIKPKPVYKPSINSGGYAILLALLENIKESPESPGLTKDTLILKAQRHSKESFTRKKPNTFYTAWSNMSRLVINNLVQKSKEGKKTKFELTRLGSEVAASLLIESEKIPTVNDIIFNNASSTPKNTECIDDDDCTITDVRENVLINQRSSQDVNIIELKAGTFDVFLLIDKNETGGLTKKNDPTVAQFNKYPNLLHEYRSLKVGDFTWVARLKENKEVELVLPYVVERKRMDDFGASIKDGRFQEQKFRLRKCGLKNVIYLIENYGSNKHVGLPMSSLNQAMANTRIQDGFKVHITDSLTSTARFLAMMTKRLTIEFKDKNLKGMSGDASADVLMTFSYFNKLSSKSKTLTVTETFIKLLLQLKGMSVEKALAITNVYKTPRCLMKAYENSSEEEHGDFLLASLKYGDLGRHVGPIVSKSVYQLLSNKALF